MANRAMDLGARDADVGKHAVVEALKQARAFANLPPTGDELANAIDKDVVHGGSPEMLGGERASAAPPAQSGQARLLMRFLQGDVRRRVTRSGEARKRNE
jgi:hypothetical protein